MIQNLQQRFASGSRGRLEDRLVLRAGSLADYQQLAEHHYLAHKPATICSVWVLADPESTAADRYAHRTTLPQVVGVLVQSMPVLTCRMRDSALAGRYGRVKNLKERASLLNAEIRCISRVIVEPRWRGMGLAVRLVRHALFQAQTIFTEAMATMGAIHPFFERAGMTAYPRPPHAFDLRLRQAMIHAGVAQDGPNFAVPTIHCVQALPPARQQWLLAELKRWHQHRFRRHGPAVANPTDWLNDARSSLSCEPVYYLSDNRKSATCLKR